MNWDFLIKNCLNKLRFRDRINFYVSCFKDKDLLEIGGPSPIFNKGIDGLLPIYKVVQSLSNVNFSYHTIWENKIVEGDTFKYGERTGKQFVLEASDLNLISDNSYNGIISSHCLEHTANPIKVIYEWKRVIKPGSYILLVLPNKEYTFDHKRPYTTFEHVLNDYNNGLDEKDLTHLDEILELHDQNMDKGLRNANFKERSLDNFKNRCLHHHVFNYDLISQIATHTGLELIKSDIFHVHMIYLLKKP